jgi:hypothetical protein
MCGVKSFTKRGHFVQIARIGQLLRRRRPVWALSLLVLFAVQSSALAADKNAPEEAASAANCFELALPITDAVEKSILRRVEQAIARLPKNGPRPIFVFEFIPAAGTAGEGSSFGDALDLARFLSGERLAAARVKTVAWVPKSIKGHAILPLWECSTVTWPFSRSRSCKTKRCGT